MTTVPGKHRCGLCCDIGVECRAVHRARDDPGCCQRALRQSGDECLCPPFAEGRAAKAAHQLAHVPEGGSGLFSRRSRL